MTGWRLASGHRCRRRSPPSSPARALVPLEIAFWLMPAGAEYWLFPTKHLILTEICILGLFALSLDLILGYAGIISLGHAAFFGLGAYAAGLLAKYGVIARADAGAARAGRSRRRGSDSSPASWCCAAGPHPPDGDARRRAGAGRDRQPARDHRRRRRPAGRRDGPVLGHFAFDIFGRTAYIYSLSVLFLMFLLARRIVDSPFGLSLRAIRGNPLRAAAIGIPSTAGWSRSTRSRPAMPASPARCWRRPRNSPRSRCSTSSARPTCC